MLELAPNFLVQLERGKQVVLRVTCEIAEESKAEDLLDILGNSEKETDDPRADVGAEPTKPATIVIPS